MKKKIAVFALLLIASLMFTATTSAGNVLGHIRTTGELRVGTTGKQPPMNATTKTGDIIGLDVDIAHAMATAMDVELKYVVLPFNELLPALEAGRVDMVISGMTMTQGRNLKVAFAGPYYVSGKGILAMAERYAALQNAEGLNAPDVKIAALKDSTSQKYAETLMPEARLTLAQSYDEALAMLLDKKIDVVVADYPFCALSAYLHQDKHLRAGKSPLTFERLGIAMAEDPLLMNWVMNFLALLHGNGELEKMQKKWLSGGSWVDELP